MEGKRTEGESMIEIALLCMECFFIGWLSAGLALYFRFNKTK